MADELNLFSDIVSEDDEGMRLDKWIANNVPDLSRSYIQKIIDTGDVKISGISTCKSSTKVKAGDEIQMQIPASVVPDILPVNIPLDILYEDDDILVVNKPKGMVVHPAAGHYDDTLVNAIMYHCDDSLSGINGVMRPGIVHRIDQDTTGSLVICKNDNSHRIIAEQLKEHSINREYRAIACGKIDVEEQTIKGYIGRDANNRKQMAVTDALHGKKAVTHIKLLQSFNKFSYVSCVLETGRTHQIRVHMNSIRHPLLGDALYGNNLGLQPPMKLQGQCLHAYKLGFNHPTTGEYMEFEAPIPEYFNHLLDILE